MEPLICAVDVGTGSARAGVLDRRGKLHGRAEYPIMLQRPAADHAEQDSEDVWRAVCSAVRTAVAKAGVNPAQVVGIGFDATCSLVARDIRGEQVTVSTTGEDRWDTIVWMDHRALAEADECTATGHRVLDFIGGVMSPEMATPKLMWLKRRLPHSWQRIGHLFDLSDFLTWRATGSLARSQCTVTAKWTYLAHEETGWKRDFLATVGLDDMLEKGRLPDRAAPVGTALGTLTPSAAAGLGLTTACRVATGLIDAFAGALGALGGFARDVERIDRHLALIAGTSSCVMAMSTRPRPFAGAWGPYFGAALPDFWLCEGGQSATGALLDHIIGIHTAGGEPTAATHMRISERIAALRAQEGSGFANRLHVLPDFHGNRSPLADPHAVGVISGLTLDASFDGLCRLYWRTAVAISLGLRHILETLNDNGYAIETINVTGGHTKNPLLMQLYADTTGYTVTEPVADEAVLLGTAMVAAAAAGLYPAVAAACVGMSQPGRARHPDAAARAAFDRDYRVFLEMHRHRQALDTLGR